MVQPDKPPTTIRFMRIGCWIPKATDSYSEYVILLAFFTATTVARTPLNVMLCVHMNCAERINLQNNFINMYFLRPNYHYVLPWLRSVKVILFRVSNTWNLTQDGFCKNEISSIFDVILTMHRR